MWSSFGFDDAQIFLNHKAIAIFHGLFLYYFSVKTQGKKNV
jgi:hypothetical protein